MPRGGGGETCIAIGKNAKVIQKSNTNVNLQQFDAIAIGNNVYVGTPLAKPYNFGNIVIGSNSHTGIKSAGQPFYNCITIGNNSYTKGFNAIAIGNDCWTTASGSTTIGTSAYTKVDGTFVIGTSVGYDPNTNKAGKRTRLILIGIGSPLLTDLQEDGPCLAYTTDGDDESYVSAYIPLKELCTKQAHFRLTAD